MKLYLIPIASVLLQFLATFLALRLIWITERVASWMIIAGAIFLMAIRRCISLYQWLFDTVSPPPLDISFEIFGLCISVLMALGLLLISPLFHSIKRSLDLLRQQHRLILDSAGEGIFGLDLEGKVTFVNPAAASLSGYRIEELLGQNIHSMIHYAKADGSPHQVEDCPIHATLKDGEIHRVAQDVFWTKDGMSFSVEYTATPTIEKNRVIGTTVVFKDITERKKMEDELRQSEEHYRGLITNGTDMITVLKTDGLIQYLSPSVEKILGYKPEELIGTDAFDLIHSEDVEKIRKLFEEVGQVEESVRVSEYRIRRKDGSWRFLESVGKNLLSHARISGIVVNSRDITDRKQAEEALQELQHRYRTLFHAAADAVFFNDLEGCLLEVNDEACGCLGYTREELLLLTVSDVTTPDYVARRPEILKQLRAMGYLVFETDFVTRDGQIIPMECSSRMMEFQGQTAVLSIARDISERKAAVARLRDNEARFRELFDNMSSAVAVYQAVEEGRDFVLIDHNHALERIERVKKEDIVGRKVSQVFPGVKDFGLFEVFQRVWRTGAPEHFPLSFYQDQRISGWKENYVYRLPSGEVVAIYDDVTQRKQAKEELSESESRYRQLVELSPDTIFIQTGGKIAYINPAGVKLFGATRPEELLGLSVLDLMHPDFKEIVAERIRHLRDETPVPRLEEKYLRLDGSVVDVEVAATPIVYQGKPGVLVMARDVAERKRSMQEIESLAKFPGENPTPVLRIASDGTILYANPSSSPLLKLWGREIGQSLPDDLRQLITKSLTVNLRKELEVECGGSIFSLTLTPITDLGYLNIYAADISERKRAEEAFQVLVNRAPMGIFIVQDRKCQMVNPGFEQITGYTAQELLGHDHRTLAHPDYREMVRANAIRMLKGELVQAYEFPIISKSGETRWVIEKVTSTIYRGKRAVLGYFLDISKHKSLEGQFLQAQKMEAVGRLAGGVAHDFNNLLSVIFGYGDLMNQKLRPQDPLARYLVKIREAADRAAGLTRQLLAFSRKTILAPEILNLNDQLAGIEEMLARLIGEDIEMRMVLEPALGAVQADPGYIEQIVMNLVINARDAMPRGGKLTLETANVFFDQDYVRRHVYATSGHYVMLAVTDNGQGMDAATQAQVFEPFFTTKELGRGTGLGLSTVYGIVKQSGGHIEVYSEVGHGTTFKVYLPRVQEAVSAVSAAKPIAMDLHGSETVLVVEDEDMLRELICRSLKIYGYTLLAARHGGEALLLCERHPEPIHLLLTDVVMPQMNGRDLADRLTPLRPDMKVLYMSGYTANAIVDHGVVETDVVFIQKPFRTKKLMEKIREILDESLPQP